MVALPNKCFEIQGLFQASLFSKKTLIFLFYVRLARKLKMKHLGGQHNQRLAKILIRIDQM